MALEVEEVLALWREAERLLDELPFDAPERTVVAAEVVDLKRIYKRLTAESNATAEILAASRETLSAAQATIAAAKLRVPAPDA